MHNLCKTDAWMPNYSWSAISKSIIDQEFFDFDEQAERLSSHGQDYLQLSQGRFYGRFVTCPLGDQISIHIEHANQALSQFISGAPDAFAVGVVLSSGSIFRTNGVPICNDRIFIVPPRVDFHLYSPRDATILAYVIDEDFFKEKLALVQRAVEWLATIEQGIFHIHSPAIASRLRHDAFNALKASQIPNPSSITPAQLGNAVIDSFFSALILEINNGIGEIGIEQRSRTFHHFSQTLDIMQCADFLKASDNDFYKKISMSRRSIQNAFAQEVGLGVSGYLRYKRLVAVRRDLRRNADCENTIGDIAAKNGFWNWSHFTKQYKQLFGELPSDIASH